MKNLKLIRLERGLSQYELALASEVPRYVIQMAETALKMPSSQQIERIANTLGVSPSTLGKLAPETGLDHE